VLDLDHQCPAAQFGEGSRFRQDSPFSKMPIVNAPALLPIILSGVGISPTGQICQKIARKCPCRPILLKTGEFGPIQMGRALGTLLRPSGCNEH
jgi:hypothetical protein